eukprot:3561805-Heterocapsa_arctica.AAC.1
MILARAETGGLGAWYRRAVETRRFCYTDEDATTPSKRAYMRIKMFVDPDLQEERTHWMSMDLIVPLRAAVKEYDDYLVNNNNSVKFFHTGTPGLTAVGGAGNSTVSA